MAADIGTEGQQGAEGAQEAQGQQEGQEAQPNPVEQRLDDLAGRFDSFEPVLNDLASALQDQGQEQEPGYQYGQPDYQQQPQFDPRTGQPLQSQEPQFYDPNTGLVDPNALNQFIESKAKQIAQQEFGPASQQLTQIQRAMEDQQIDGLLNKYTELRDDPKAREATAQQANEIAYELAESITNDPQQVEQLRERIVMNPQFFERVYLAGKAGDTSQSAEGVPGGNGQAHVEGASSAQQQQTGPPDGDEFWRGVINAR